jgi:hypothetical protein
MNRGPQNKGKQKPKGTKIKGITYFMGNTNKRATSDGIKRVITHRDQLLKVTLRNYINSVQ